MTQSLTELGSAGFVLFLSGGVGAWMMVKNKKFIETLKSLVEYAEFILTVCTGSILLSKTGILDGKKATSN